MSYGAFAVYEPYERDAEPYERDAEPYERDAEPYERDAEPYERDAEPYERAETSTARYQMLSVTAPNLSEWPDITDHLITAWKNGRHTNMQRVATLPQTEKRGCSRIWARAWRIIKALSPLRRGARDSTRRCHLIRPKDDAQYLCVRRVAIVCFFLGVI